jgi:hypothetical protein
LRTPLAEWRETIFPSTGNVAFVPDFVIALALPDQFASTLAENAPHVAGEVGHDLRDHQFRLFNGAQLLPIDDD